MQLNYQALDEWDWITWDSFFYVFSISKYRILLPLAGVPDLITQHPEILVKSTEIYWNCRYSKTRNVKVKNLEEYNINLKNERNQLISVIERVFSLANEKYGDQTTEELYHWSQRNFIDKSLIRKWDIWSILFLKLEKGIVNNSPTINLVDRESVREILVKYIYKLQGVESREIVELINKADELKLNRDEKRLIRLETNYLTLPDDPKEIDVSSLISECIQRQGAYEIVSAIYEFINVIDQHEILNWGKSWSVSHNMTDETTFPFWQVP